MTASRSVPRSAARIGIALLLVAMIAVAGRAAAEEIVVFERADFLLSGQSQPPKDGEGWTPVALPHEWRHSHPGVSGRGWYRIRFDLVEAPVLAQAVMIAHERSQGSVFFVNGRTIGGSRDLISRAGWGFSNPLYLVIPPGMLRAGSNVIHVRMLTSAHPENIQGLGRVTYGQARPVRAAAATIWEYGFYADRSFAAMAFAAGLITLFVWFARRSDQVMLWFSITCLTWAVVNVCRFWLRWLDSPSVHWALHVYTTYGLVVPSVILCLRTIGLRRPLLEAALWTYLAAEITYPLWSDVTNILVRNSWDVANTLLLIAGAALVLRSAPRPLRLAYRFEIAALLVMAALMFSEVARFLGWVDIESPVVRQYHVPVMLLAIGAAIFDRHVLAVWRIERANLELERRVEEKAREIRAYHDERQEVLRRQALAQERHRIISDMHDGLGASLVGLLRYVQSRPGDPRGIEQRVREALQEMRIAIDALEPAQGDLASVLGSLRYRLEPLTEAVGVRLAWDVAEMPKVEALDAPAVSAVQRAVLEAIFNALKHSDARAIRLAAAPREDGIEIRVEDDGRGFDPALPSPGRGLGTMRERMLALGGCTEVVSRPHAGTAVIFHVPYTLAGGHAAPGSEAVASAAAGRRAALAPDLS